MLTVNPNADIYLDVGYWTLMWPDSTKLVADTVKSLVSAGRVKGITLNTSNYRSTAELSALCWNFQNAMGSTAYRCVVDTSRNFNAPTTVEWCNVKTAGIGNPPTSDTGVWNLDYFMWIKVPGESDGTCNDGTHLANSMVGPDAGAFFPEIFISLWNQGYFVSRLGSPRIASVPGSTVVDACLTPAWDSCGDSDSGAKCCPSGFFYQPWNLAYYQCMQAPVKCSQQFTDTDFGGADLQKMTGMSPTDCCLKCVETAECAGYTFVNQDGASCYLKSQGGSQMARRFVHGALCLAVAATLLLHSVAGAEDLCSLPPLTYTSAKIAYPQVASALMELEKFPIATWYSDRNGNDYVARAKKLVASCSKTSRLSIVVYGMPGKDCASGESSSGATIKTSDDYVAFITTLVDIVGDRKVLYVVEPDAIAQSLTNKSCGVAAGYPHNLAKAVHLLSTNANAQLYLDVGYWTLETWESTSQVIDLLKTLVVFGKVQGIALNTANYRSNAEIAGLCTTFQTAIGSTSFTCVADTSRNYVAPASTEWCNLRTAGVGAPPSAQTGFANLDYFLWLKPPGDSDGKCDDGSHGADSLQGPAAGLFFEFGFQVLWNQGYFVQELKREAIALGPATTAPSVCGVSGGVCGNAEVGAKCCREQNEYCQPWTSEFYQCLAVDTKCGAQQVGIEIQGDDLATYFGVLPGVCCDTCVITDGCRAYTFLSQDSTHDGKSACYLKSGLGVKSPLVGAVSAKLA